MYTTFYISNRINCPINFLSKLLLCESRSLTEGFYFPSKTTLQLDGVHAREFRVSAVAPATDIKYL